MSRKTRTFFCFFLLLFSAVLSGKPIQLEIWYDEFPPYFLNPNDSENPGFAVELIRKVLPAKDFTLVWRKGWSSAVTGLEQGNPYKKYQVIAAMHPADTGKASCSSLPLFTVESALFVLKSQKIKFTEILPEGRGTMPRDWSVSDEADAVIEKRIKARKMTLFPLSQSAVKGCQLLFAKRVRFLINDPVSVDWTLSRMKRKPEGLKKYPLPGMPVSFYTGFAKGSSNARKAEKLFKKNYPGFLRTEEYAALRKKYHLPNNIKEQGAK